MGNILGSSPENDALTRSIHRLISEFGEEDSWRAHCQLVTDKILKGLMEGKGIKPSKGGVCISRVLGKKCVGLRHRCYPPATDHASLFSIDEKPAVFFSQPYYMSDNELRELDLFCRENGLSFTITADFSWHFPGRTLLVAIAPKEGRYWMTLEERKASRP